MPPTAAELWQLLPWGYLLTITLETPVLLFGLSERHSWQRTFQPPYRNDMIWSE